MSGLCLSHHFVAQNLTLCLHQRKLSPDPIICLIEFDCLQQLEQGELSPGVWLCAQVPHHLAGEEDFVMEVGFELGLK